MGTGWKVWFGLLGLVSLYGLALINEAQSAADFNEALASGAPQQTVVGLWHLQDLVAALIVMLIVLIVAVASIGVVIAGQRTESVSSLPSRTIAPTPPDTPA